MTDRVFERLLVVGTAAIADIFDSNGLEPPVLTEDLHPVGRTEAFIGTAFTVIGESVTSRDSSDRAKLRAIDEMPAGVVPVWAGTDIRGVCCFGDLLCEAMKCRGSAGAVVDGGIRDVAYLQQLGFPVLARYHTPAQAIGRWKVISHQVPVRVRGALRDWVTVEPGDVVVADGDGVIVVPHALAGQVAEESEQKNSSDSLARQAIRGGMPLIAALDRFGQL